MNTEEKMELVYDGECPICRTYCENVRLADDGKKLELVDARKPGPVMDLITEKGLDIDEGMALKIGDKLFYGSDAVSELSKYTDRRSITGIMNQIFFRSRFLAGMFYPPAKAVRNSLLYLLGIEKIKNLGKRS